MHFIKVSIALLASVGMALGFDGETKVDRELLQKLSTTTTLTSNAPLRREDIMVRFPGLSAASLTASVSTKLARHAGFQAAGVEGTLAARRMQRGIRRMATQDVLRDHRDNLQEEALTALNNLGYQYTTFWINNVIFVRDASLELIYILAEMNDVEMIDMNRIVANIDQPIEIKEHWDSQLTVEAGEASSTAPGILWNLKDIFVDEAWEITRGEDIIVANIDTGVKYDHEALIENYRGYAGKNKGIEHDYNWFDPRSVLYGADDASVSAVPQDRNGHGTHTMGSIVGKNIGVAPGAKWIAAKGCATFGCSSADLTASAEWVLCPKNSAGQENCMLGADVVSNSWGGGRGANWFAPLVDAWLAAGVIPIFSQGNAGPRCATANSPGDLATVIGVGSSNRQFSLSRFSSRGPGIGSEQFPLMKPDITAPGEKIYSSYKNGKYATLSGTSMAGPHVAGLAVLILSVKPQATYDDMYEILTTTAMQEELKAPATTPVCSNISYNEFPNYHYGHGLIHALKAVKMAKDMDLAVNTNTLYY